MKRGPWQGIDNLFDEDGYIHARAMGQWEGELDNTFPGNVCIVCGEPLCGKESKVCQKHSQLYKKVNIQIDRLCELARERDLEKWFKGFRIVIAKRDDQWFYEIYDDRDYPFASGDGFGSQKDALRGAKEIIDEEY